MANYYNEEKLFDWYEGVAKSGLKNRGSLLAEMLENAKSAGVTKYTLPGSKTLSGKDETYTYRVEDVGCCGSSTVNVYF